MNSKLITQLFREFWLPAAAAGAWVAYGLFSDIRPVPIAASVTRFSAAFFFCSWLTGQIFRVSKQAKTEQTLSSLEKRVVALVGDLERESTSLRNMATGGDSFARIILGLHTPSAPTVMVTHEGEHPLYGVSARMVDLQLFSKLPATPTWADLAATERNFSVGDMTPGYGSMIDPAAPLNAPAHDYNIFFSARNGGWTQEYRARLIGGDWVSATVVTRMVRGSSERPVALALRDSTFPDSDLPGTWPADGQQVHPATP